MAEYSSLPPLPSDFAEMKGPISTSNWVIPGKLIAGSYPGSADEKKHKLKITNIIQCGVTRIVCLMQPGEVEWLHLFPYKDTAIQLAEEYGRKLNFEYFPMPDLSTADEDKLLNYIPKLADTIRDNNEIVYVHCWGGHGRTGIVIALLLSVLYDLDSEEALRLTELYHSKRTEARLHSPQTSSQMEQVRTVSKMLKANSQMLKNGVLPPISPNFADMRGPTPTSNWVIPGRLIAGAYPGSLDPIQHRKTIEKVIASGVTVFVCLMTESDKARFVPYEDIAYEYAMIQKQSVRFENLHMPDGFIPEDKLLLDYIPKLADTIRDNNEIVYVHCWGGHGRTGIVIALLLSVLYDLDSEEALRLTELYHSKRTEARLHSPTTRAQINQVERLVILLKKNK